VNNLENSAVWSVLASWICYDEDRSVKSLCFIVCIFPAIVVGDTEFEWLEYWTICPREAGELRFNERFHVGDNNMTELVPDGV